MLLAHRRDGHRRDAEPQAHVDQPRHVVRPTASRTRRRRTPAPPSPRRSSGRRPRYRPRCARSDSSLRMLGPPLARITTPLGSAAGMVERRMPRVQHQRVGVRQQRDDVEVDALEPGRRALEIAVIDRQHDRAPALGPEDPGEPVLHSPVVGAGPLQKEARGRPPGCLRRSCLSSVLSASGMGCAPW